MKHLLQKLLITASVVIVSLFNPVIQSHASGRHDKKYPTQNTRDITRDMSFSAVVGSYKSGVPEPVNMSRVPSNPRKTSWITCKAKRANKLSRELLQLPPYQELLNLACELSTKRKNELEQANAIDMAHFSNAFGRSKQFAKIHSKGVSEGVSESDSDSALRAIAAEVVRRKTQLIQTNACKAQSLAMMANGFSRVSGCETALQVIAAEIVRRQQQLSDVQVWTAQHLAMVANGFSKVRGCEAALQVIATEVVKRQTQLSEANDWVAQHLAMVANGLSGVVGCEMALQVIAEVVVSRRAQLSKAKGWNAQHLSMVANGFSGVSGTETALKAIAAEIVSRKAQLMTKANGWTAKNLAMLANGFRGVSGCEAALKKIATEVVRRRTQLSEANGWNEQHLAMVASGFNGVSGCETALKTIADVVVRRQLQRREVNDWDMRHLAMLACAFSRGGECQAALEKIFAVVATRSLSDWTAKSLSMMLQALCHSFISGSQIELGITLLSVLYHEQNEQLDAELLWYLTVLDFVMKFNPQQIFFEAMPSGYRLLEELFFDTLSCTASGKIIFPSTALPAHWKDNQWQGLFASIYWYYPARHWSECKVVRPHEKPEVSRLQSDVYTALVNALGEEFIDMEVQIEQFPVDILVGSRLCIEVDGPYHFFQENSQGRMDEESPVIRNPVDFLVDHILKKSGFQVMRIAYSQVSSAEGLNDFVSSVKRMMDQEK